MKASPACYALIREFESYRPKAYVCPAGKPTIAWGHTKGVKMGMTCTPAEAEAWLREDVEEAEALVLSKVKVPLTQGQFDALCSFAFNVRKAKFNERDCTLLRKLNAGDPTCVDEFIRWNKGVNPKTGKLEELRGLTRRRKREAELFRS